MTDIAKIPELIWESDTCLKINDVTFHLSYDSNELHSWESTENNFLLAKHRDFVENSVSIKKEQQVSKVFEMGIYKGGSLVLYDQVFQPEKIVGIEYIAEPADAIYRYIVSV